MRKRFYHRDTPTRNLPISYYLTYVFFLMYITIKQIKRQVVIEKISPGLETVTDFGFFSLIR